MVISLGETAVAEQERAALLVKKAPVQAFRVVEDMPMIMDVLRQEHRNIEKLLVVLEQELSVFYRAERPDYELIKAVITYFAVYPDTYHHPLENIIFEKLKARDPAAARK